MARTRSRNVRLNTQETWVTSNLRRLVLDVIERIGRRERPARREISIGRHKGGR
jgi:hypothetical protein